MDNRSTSGNYILKILLIICYSYYFVNQNFAQNLDPTQRSELDDNFSVQFVHQISTSKDLPKSNTLSNRIFSFFVGSEEKKLIRPTGFVTTKDGQWFITDQGNEAVIHIHQNEGTFKRIGERSFPSPVGICADSQDQIYFTDSFLNKIFRGSINKTKLSIMGDSLQLDRPTGIAFEPKREEFWVVETMAHQITILNRDGTIVRHIGNRGTSPGEFNFPTSIWIDENGLVYIVDSMNFRIQVMNLDGEIISVFGEAGDATGYFARPKGIATDSFGNIYIVDALFHTVQIFNLQGRFLLYFGEQGREPGQFWLPSGIYIDAENNIYVADSYNSRIQVFRLIRGIMNEN
jgi:sugar lactone lactonase YvrE